MRTDCAVAGVACCGVFEVMWPRFPRAGFAMSGGPCEGSWSGEEKKSQC